MSATPDEEFDVIPLNGEFGRSKLALWIVSAQERLGVDKVLNAAALTYVAAVVSTLMTLLYFLFRAGLLGGSRD